jgi:hypothetical protein
LIFTAEGCLVFHQRWKFEIFNNLFVE